MKQEWKDRVRAGIITLLIFTGLVVLSCVIRVPNYKFDNRNREIGSKDSLSIPLELNPKQINKQR